MKVIWWGWRWPWKWRPYLHVRSRYGPFGELQIGPISVLWFYKEQP